jgi:hypothetical protein
MTKIKERVLIANAGGYWGDDPYALRRQVESDLPLDYISIDYLAEITMSIMQKQRARDPKEGFARDFVTQVAPLLPMIKKKGLRIITNAGGVNPRGCADALFDAARQQGVDLRVAVIEGDDVKDKMSELFSQGNDMSNMDDGRSFAVIKDHVLSANAYFGAMPVVAALAHEPDVILCGRVTDTGITLGALRHAFQWAEDDYDRLACGIVAGHIIECGAQASGGNFTDWKKVPSFRDVGYPVVECFADGSFVVTKAPGSGGLVSCQTVREQLLYEMGEPTSYITPDVIANFADIQLEAAGDNRVKVWGATGRPPTDTLKLSISYAEGFKAAGTLIVSGPDALAKAQCFSQIFWEKVQAEVGRAGCVPLVETRSEFIGHDATHGPLTPQHQPSEILLRLAARAAEEAPLRIFRKILPSLILSGPSGVAVTGGAPAIQEIVSYWPALLPQEHAPARFSILQGGQSAKDKSAAVLHNSQTLSWPVTHGVPTRCEPDDTSDAQGPLGASVPSLSLVHAAAGHRTVPLMVLAHARSGDKGDTANIGLIGRSPEAFAFLQRTITSQVVKVAFGDKCLGRVKRYAVPNLWALNFLLEHSLGGGGTRSLHLDAQGKTFGQALLRLLVSVPEGVLASLPKDTQASTGELVP